MIPLFGRVDAYVAGVFSGILLMLLLIWLIETTWRHMR